MSVPRLISDHTCFSLLTLLPHINSISIFPLKMFNYLGPDCNISVLYRHSWFQRMDPNDFADPLALPLATATSRLPFLVMSEISQQFLHG